jgi:hypothetical protein
VPDNEIADYAGDGDLPMIMNCIRATSRVPDLYIQMLIHCCG